MGTYLPGSGTLAWVVWCEVGVSLGSLAPEVSPPDLYPPCVGVGFLALASLPLLLVWVNVTSLISSLFNFDLVLFSDDLGDSCVVF